MAKHLHLLGICGTFMGGLAIIARQLGFRVTGSDENIYPPMSETLRAQGIEIQEGYCAEHLKPRPDLVIIGNVTSRGNAAVEAVLDQSIPYTSGPDWLAREVLAKRHVLAVAGTHGKTTITSLLTWVLQYTGHNPGYLIGGVANNFDTSASLGSAPYFVIEADEYDSAFFDKRPKFIHYKPSTLIINNIEFDHSDIYQDLAEIQKQFSYLLRTVAGKNLVLTAEQDQNTKMVLQSGIWSRHAVFSGPNAQWQYRLLQADASEFALYYCGAKIGEVKWDLLGDYNVENALAALAAVSDLQIEPTKAVAALNAFKGVRRRMETVGCVNDVTVYDDFAHHPTAIAQSLKALRARIGNKPLVAIVEFASNTMRSAKHEYADIAKALQIADRIVLLKPDNQEFDMARLCEPLAERVQVFGTVDAIVAKLPAELNPDDSVLIMSNQGFGGLHKRLLQQLSAKQAGS